MSECVVRMEMPQNCGECRFRSDGWCYGIREFDPQPGPLDFEKRPSWCPIICQLPEGHGRMVDKDEVIESIRTEMTELFFNGMKGTPRPTDDLRMMWNRLEDEDLTPTIVPAERSET